jgi:hypothetical protein
MRLPYTYGLVGTMERKHWAESLIKLMGRMNRGGEPVVR